MLTLVKALALDLAGLGCLGAGAYSLISRDGGTTAATTLIALGGTYLGVKLSVTVPVASPSTPGAKAAPPAA